MDDPNGCNQRRRARQIYEEEDDSKTIRRRQANQVVNEPQNDDAQADGDDEGLPLSLSLGPTSYYSQIPTPATSSLRLAPPPSRFDLPPTIWQSPDFMARMASSHSYFMTSPPNMSSSSLSNNLYQTGYRGSPTPTMQSPLGPPVSYFPPSGFAPPSNPTPARPVRSVAPEDEPRRGSRSQAKEDTIPPPFPWATNKRGWIHSLEYLESKQITTITGDVQCKNCEKVYQLSYNLKERFAEVENIFVTRKRIMRERAPSNWTNPEAARCEHCGRDKAVKPVIAERKSQINWLFLLLGQTLGYCTLSQLKNFCKHSKSHRTGAKDRVLYLTYLGLCKMLEPNRELFNREPFRR
ncbi:unnamed protein product [Microthlaspi erraticum]|uniref:DUF7086 domain-containing protein n=1 Tax=Microthlaspi erraticum TaxID=1685480 RepID=A0A6D2K7Z9_9BRAS|nr:unnamed protein product [Microthlaspi erraticum]